MRKLAALFLFIAIVVIALVLVPQVVVIAQEPIPPVVPHTLEGRDACANCHMSGAQDVPQAPQNHQGRMNNQCLLCHVPGFVPGESTGDGQSGSSTNGIPNIPHTLEGRTNCLGCHGSGTGGAPKIPPSHKGRTSSQCRNCHQPATAAPGQAPLPVPTPNPHVAPVGNTNSCVTCHSTASEKSAKIVKDWTGSIHAERGVTCVDCHGGDATAATQEAAESPRAGFVGAPKKQDIPALCASCHADVEMMRQYSLPTDQWTQYRQSIHGKKLAEGNNDVPTCFVCHDQHGTKKVADPQASVYPMNVPELCGGCHSNAGLMQPYHIPTNQYELYKDSVHGIALLQNQDTRAPTCATCHGTHGAAPPGFKEVQNVCGSCHTATQDYYLKSVHAGNDPEMPKCVTCHGRYDVGKPTDAIFVEPGSRNCSSCHPADSAQADIAQALYKSIDGSAKAIDQAQAAIQRASDSSLIMAPEEGKLAQARTDLITARAAQHTLDADLVKKKTDSATATANQVTADAEKAINESLFRREFMGLGLGIMVLSITGLWIVRRALYKQLPKK